MMTINKKLRSLIDRDVLILLLIIIVTIPIFIISFRQPASQTNNFCKPSGVSSGTDTVKIYVSKSSSYSVWLRLESPIQINFNDLPGIYNPLLVSVDKSCYQVGGNGSMPLNTWAWVNSLNANPAKNFKVSLSKGEHSLSITGSYVSIDQVELLGNSCVPMNTGANCLPQPNPIIYLSSKI